MDRFIYDGPYVELIARSTYDSGSFHRWLKKYDTSWAGDPVEFDYNDGSSIVEAAGRTCYWSFERGRSSHLEYVQNIISKRHGSVLEHVSFTFAIGGISRACSHELVRHRAGWSYSQLSTRYVGPEQVRFVVPREIRNDPDLLDRFRRECMDALKAYEEIHDGIEKRLAEKYPPYLTKTLKKKWIRQLARYVLPNCTETRLIATANVRAIRHFLELRGSRYADVEIRKLANAIFAIVRREEPILFKDYTTIDLEDGTFEIQTDWPKA